MNSIDNKQETSDIGLDTLFNFFKNLNANTTEDTDPTMENFNVHIDEDTDDILNCYITENEIIKCIQCLKNNKACSNDRIINEYLKHTTDIMTPIYVHFFNLILDTGFLPESWLEGIIRPIYKRKGDPYQPENYRPITILSCFGKLFTSILNARLHKFLELNNILEENQAGFRTGYTTTDHIFVLHSLIELLKVKKTKLFCSFIDFSKAFDSVWRVGLWMKLLGNNINGKIFRVIHNMYKNIKSCVSYNGEQSSFFQSFRGVRQGENLSPVLFAIFLNDLESFLITNGASGVNLDLQHEQLTIFTKIYILLYADARSFLVQMKNNFKIT
ncbi:MAG: reverse transcriptase family protein [Candidatus Thiodiazotropha endolucinida]|nr:reverse transcriptase family protein [Candidatus Thiodiazotropha taylori]MCW4260188.1 reverse transcriptase family protein [Candidatus Thiodiazotropha endolucinida]